MLSTVLRSPTAITVSIQIMRAFVRLRQLMDEDEKRTRKPRIGYHTEAKGRRRQ